MDSQFILVSFTRRRRGLHRVVEVLMKLLNLLHQRGLKLPDVVTADADAGTFRELDVRTVGDVVHSTGIPSPLYRDRQIEDKGVVVVAGAGVGLS